MDDKAKNGENKSSTQQKGKKEPIEPEDLENESDFKPTEITDEQRLEQDTFFDQFIDFSPTKIPKFLYKEYESQLSKNIQSKSTLFQEIRQFYKNEQQNTEKIKNKILSHLNDFQYSANHLSIIAKFFQSYTTFQDFCISAQLILDNQNFPNPPYQIFERTILLNILNTHRSLTLNNLLFKFKHFSLTKRKEILTTAVERFIFSVRKEDSSIPILTKTKERVTSELSRLSQHLGISYDLESYDGQLFKYSCETLLSEYQRLHFSFNLVPVTQPKPRKLYDRINGSFMETFSKNDLIVEAFNNIVKPNDTYSNDLVDTLTVKKFSRDLIVSWVTLRFCRNRQLLSQLEKSVSLLCSSLQKIYSICKIQLKDDDRTFCDKYISFIVEQILVFSSAVFARSNKKADIDPLLEISIDKFIHFTEAKIKILSLFAEIAKHSDPEKVREITDVVIDKRPNLIFHRLSFFDHFDSQIETLEMIGKCLSVILNIQILNERQITAFYGSFYEQFQFGTFFSNEGEGEFNISKFEIYLSIEKVLDFISIASKTVDEVCSTMSIKAVDYSDYIELGVWTELLNEITQFPEVSIFGTDFSAVRFNLAVSKDVESLINCRLLNDPLFVKNFIDKIDQTASKSDFTSNLTKFCLLAFKLRSLVYKTNQYLSLYLRQYEEVHSTTGTPKTIEFIGKSFNFVNYDEIQKLCLSGDFSEIIEIVNCQKRYNIMLMIATQHNNFRSDNEIVSILFNLAKPDNIFNFTKAETTVDADMKFYKDAAKMFFVDFDSFFNQDYGSIFFNISEVTDFSDTKNLTAKLKKYANRIELATITNYERSILRDFQQIELFTLDSKFYRPEDGFVDYFSIPGFSQCLLLDCESDKFDEIIGLVAIRLQLISFIRFNFFIKCRLKNPYMIMYNRKINWESQFFSKLNSSPQKTLSEALKLLNAESVYELGRFQVALLQRLQKNFTTNRDSPQIDEIRNLWKIVNQEYETKVKLKPIVSFNNISIERYIPIYLSRFNFTFSNDLKSDIIIQFREIEKQIQRNIVFKDAVNPELELGDYMSSEIVNELLKFVLLRLNSNTPYTDLNILSLVEITPIDYEENLHFHTNFFSVPGKPRLPKLVENKLLKQPIITIVGKAQKKVNEERYEKSTEELKVFDSINSQLKPDIYIEKTKFENQKLQPYNPTPENAKIQYDQEMRFANNKIVSMIIQAINLSIISDKRVIFNTSSRPDLNLNNNLLAEKLEPLSYYLVNFIERSRPQILKTWLSYTEIMKEIALSFDQGEILESLFKKKFNITLNFQLGSKYFDDFVKLAKLREIEKATNKENAIFVIQTTNEIRNEYEETLSELSKEKEELMKQYQVIRNKLFGLTGNIIQKQKDKIPENEKILKPNNEEAEKSLETSKKEGFTLEVDDNLRNEIFSSSSSIEEEKKKNEEEDDTEEFPTFNFASFRNARDDSTVAFTPVRPPPRLPANMTMRRNTMIRPGARALLLARQNQFKQEQEQEKKEEEQPKSPMNEILKHIENSKNKFKEVEKELPGLKKEILKLRITRCLFRIAVSKNFKKGKNTLSRERKEASTQFWSNRKIFEEDLREMNDKIDSYYQRLLKAEIDSENLRNDLSETKKVTTKLIHWKDLNLKTTDQILKQINEYEKGPNVDVNKLLKKLDHKRAELDALCMDEESFETDLYYKVTQPLQEISRVRRYVQSEKYNYLKMKQTTNNQDEQIDEDKANDIMDENLKLKLENKRLKSQIEQIEQLENKDEPLPPIQIDDSKKTIELPQLPSARRIRSYSQRRPPIKPRSLYSNYGYRSIRRP